MNKASSADKPVMGFGIATVSKLAAGLQSRKNEEYYARSQEEKRRQMVYRAKLRTATSFLVEMCCYILFLAIFVGTSDNARDEYAFDSAEVVRSQIATRSPTGWRVDETYGAYGDSFRDIKDPHSFYTWLQGTFIPLAIPTHVGGRALPHNESFFFATGNRVLGPLRMRAVRATAEASVDDDFDECEEVVRSLAPTRLPPSLDPSTSPYGAQRAAVQASIVPPSYPEALAMCGGGEVNASASACVPECGYGCRTLYPAAAMRYFRLHPTDVAVSDTILSHLSERWGGTNGSFGVTGRALGEAVAAEVGGGVRVPRALFGTLKLYDCSGSVRVVEPSPLSCGLGWVGSAYTLDTLIVPWRIEIVFNSTADVDGGWKVEGSPDGLGWTTLAVNHAGDLRKLSSAKAGGVGVDDAVEVGLRGSPLWSPSHLEAVPLSGAEVSTAQRAPRVYEVDGDGCGDAYVAPEGAVDGVHRCLSLVSPGMLWQFVSGDEVCEEAAGHPILQKYCSAQQRSVTNEVIPNGGYVVEVPPRGSSGECGGRVLDGRERQALAQHEIRTLIRGEWLDASVRFVVIEFTTYNANTDILTATRLVVEVLPTGPMLALESIKPMAMTSSGSDFATLVVGDCLVLVAVVAWMIDIGFTVVKLVRYPQSKCFACHRKSISRRASPSESSGSDDGDDDDDGGEEGASKSGNEDQEGGDGGGGGKGSGPSDVDVALPQSIAADGNPKAQPNILGGVVLQALMRQQKLEETWFPCPTCETRFDIEQNDMCPTCTAEVQPQHLCRRGIMHKTWLMIDVPNYVLFVGLFVFRLLLRIDVARVTLSDPAYFPAYYPLAWLLSYTDYANSANLLLCFIKTLKYLARIRALALPVSTLSHALDEILRFLFLYSLLFMGFVVAYLLAFGTDLAGYHNIVNVVESLWLMLIGVFDFGQLWESNRVLGPTFFVLYLWLMFIVLINMFIAIIDDAYIRANNSMATQRFEYLNSSLQALQITLVRWASRRIPFLADDALRSLEECLRLLSRMSQIPHLDLKLAQELRAFSKALEDRPQPVLVDRINTAFAAKHSVGFFSRGALRLFRDKAGGKARRSSSLGTAPRRSSSRLMGGKKSNVLAALSASQSPSRASEGSGRAKSPSRRNSSAPLKSKWALAKAARGPRRSSSTKLTLAGARRSSREAVAENTLCAADVVALKRLVVEYYRDQRMAKLCRRMGSFEEATAADLEEPEETGRQLSGIGGRAQAAQKRVEEAHRVHPDVLAGVYALDTAMTELERIARDLLLKRDRLLGASMSRRKAQLRAARREWLFSLATPVDDASEADDAPLLPRYAAVGSNDSVQHILPWSVGVRAAEGDRGRAPTAPSTAPEDVEGLPETEALPSEGAALLQYAAQDVAFTDPFPTSAIVAAWGVSHSPPAVGPAFDTERSPSADGGPPSPLTPPRDRSGSAASHPRPPPDPFGQDSGGSTPRAVPINPSGTMAAAFAGSPLWYGTMVGADVNSALASASRGSAGDGLSSHPVTRRSTAEVPRGVEDGRFGVPSPTGPSGSISPGHSPSGPPVGRLVVGHGGAPHGSRGVLSGEAVCDASAAYGAAMLRASGYPRPPIGHRPVSGQRSMYRR